MNTEGAQTSTVRPLRADARQNYERLIVAAAAAIGELGPNVSLEEVVFTHGEAPRQANRHGRYHWLGQKGKTYHATYSMTGYVSQTHAVTVGEGISLKDVSLVPTDPTYVPHDPLPGDKTTGQPSTVELAWQCTGVTSFDVHFGLAGDPPGCCPEYIARLLRARCPSLLARAATASP